MEDGVVDERQRHQKEDECNPSPPPSTTLKHVFLGQALAIETRWDVGIGGGVWTTGLLVCEYFERHAAFFTGVFRGKGIIEIGSGTGLVGLSLASNSQFQPCQVVVTDQKDHLGLIQRNVDVNATKLHAPLLVQEFDWLRKKEEGENVALLSSSPFDVIVGTDVAYCKELYAPVVHALEQVAGPESLILLGVTRTDTGPLFFQLLHNAGFDYCLMPTAVGDGGEGSCVEAGGFALLSVVRRRGRGEKEVGKDYYNCMI